MKDAKLHYKFNLTTAVGTPRHTSASS